MATSHILENSDEAAKLIELSLDADRAEFQREALSSLARTVGYACALFLTLDSCGGSRPTKTGLVLAGLGADYPRRFWRHAAAFERDLEPVKRFALEHGGAAVDTHVLGGCEREKKYYEELVRPAGGGHSLLCYLELRGEAVGLVMLGRERSRAFREDDLRRVLQLRPALILATASYAGGHREPPTAGERVPHLTPREQELVDYISRGYTNGEIGLALGTSPNTVRNQLSVLYEKVGVTTRAELAGLWSRR